MLLTSKMKVGFLPRVPIVNPKSQILWKAGRYKLAPKAFGAGCTCLENRIGNRRGRSITDAFRHRPVAQEQSARLISERTRSVTARDDQFMEGEPRPRVAEAD